MAIIKIAPEAISDMKQIKAYIAETLLSQLAAQKQINDIYQKIERLQAFPLMGTSLFGKVEIQNDYRFLVSGHYMIFYRFDRDTVYIVRVLYGKSDYMNILFES